MFSTFIPDHYPSELRLHCIMMVEKFASPIADIVPYFFLCECRPENDFMHLQKMMAFITNCNIDLPQLRENVEDGGPFLRANLKHLNR